MHLLLDATLLAHQCRYHAMREIDNNK
jgi:hypothetical protein